MARTEVRGLRSSVLGERANKKKGRGFRGGWQDRLDIPKAATTPILLTSGEYEDIRPREIEENGGTPPHKHYAVYKFHTLKQGDAIRTGKCRGGYEGNLPCLACQQKAEGDNRVATKDQYSLNILHLAPHVREQLKDKKGQPQRYDKDGEHHKRGDPIMVWREANSPKQLKEIRASAEEMLEAGELCLYRKKFIQVGFGHLEHVMQIDELASKRCLCGGELSPVAFHCRKCKEELLLVEETELTVEEIARYDQERQRCPSCGHFDFTERTVICNNCDAAQPMSIFDVVAFVRRSGEGTNSTVVCEKIVPVTEFELLDGSLLLETDEDGNPMMEADDEWAWREEVKKSRTQFDFEQVHRPQDNEFVAAFLKVENPFRSDGAAHRYDEPDGEDGEESPAPSQQRRPTPPIRRTPVRR